MKTAKFWKSLENDRGAACLLCPHECVVAPGKTGSCGVRDVQNGKLIDSGYGLISSAGIDPIEKKPLYHFYPGKSIFSIGGWGCNFHCDFCQNWGISQQIKKESQVYDPETVVVKASMNDSIGIAYTYNEPLVGYEFVLDCARIAKSKKLANVLVTNGYINPEPAGELLPFIDALNIDIKSMDSSFYKHYCKGSLDPVLSFAVQAAQAGCHLEITNLLIPGLNDDEHYIEELAKWIKENIGSETPLHLSGYHPQYKMNNPSTSVSLLEKAYRICREFLDYVYLGNVDSTTGRDTVCPTCSATLVSRLGYATSIHEIEMDKCSGCGMKINGRF